MQNKYSINNYRRINEECELSYQIIYLLMYIILFVNVITMYLILYNFNTYCK